MQDNDGPAPNAEVVLDQDRKIRTDEDGRFVFSQVDAGNHCISLSNRVRMLVPLGPGERREIRLSQSDVSMECIFTRNGESLALDATGIVCGLRTGTLSNELEVRAGKATLELPIIEDSFFFIGDDGIKASIRISPEGMAIAELGTAKAKVHATVGAFVYAVPTIWLGTALDFLCRRTALQIDETMSAELLMQLPLQCRMVSAKDGQYVEVDLASTSGVNVAF